MEIDVPPDWKKLTCAPLEGIILVIGAPDTGKTTFARYLYRRLCTRHERVGFIDGDMGQATLGPPTTMTLALSNPDNDAFPPAGPCHRAFVGDVTPRGHMLPTLVGAHRLVQKAREEGATEIVFDTTGLVGPDQGGGALKRAKIDLLHPAAVVGIQHERELEHLLHPLRLSGRTRVIDLPASRAARRRDYTVRREHRASQFRRYFANARPLEIEWQYLAILPEPAFAPSQLVALEDKGSLTLALGIVAEENSARDTVTLHTPLATSDEVNAIHLGNLALDPRSFRESRPR
jgi:polynucleotide 5'-hydroxyl-kinase GRC3/NOL9